MIETQHFADHPAVAIAEPCDQRAALVVASPHSGRDYPAEFLARTRLDAHSVRQSEDFWIDRLIAGIGALGAPVLTALFPRAYLDVNREPYELDPRMFDRPLPGFCNSASSRVLAGLGTIPRLVGAEAEIYHGELPLSEAIARIELCYRPYHAALDRLIQRTRRRFGRCALLDIHSMPGLDASISPQRDRRASDIVLGDCYGTACAASLTCFLEAAFHRRGYAVARNDPYAGGFVTRHYGQPERGVHVLQIELSRALYMDEGAMRPKAGFDRLRRDLTGIAAELIQGLNGNLFPLEKQAAE